MNAIYIDDSCPIQCHICCACGKWFAFVKNFVDHARSCDDFKVLPACHKDIYAALLHLREGALTA